MVVTYCSLSSNTFPCVVEEPWPIQRPKFCTVPRGCPVKTCNWTAGPQKPCAFFGTAVTCPKIPLTWNTDVEWFCLPAGPCPLLTLVALNVLQALVSEEPMYWKTSGYGPIVSLTKQLTWTALIRKFYGQTLSRQGLSQHWICKF